MNTKDVRKIAISKQIGELMESACKYSPEILARWDSPIEPNEAALFQFMDEVSRIAKCHYKNNLQNSDILYLIEFCKEVGRDCGHVFSDGRLTGTWGVRISELLNLQKILKIDDFELLPIGSKITKYNTEYTITGYEITADWIVVKLIYLYDGITNSIEDIYWFSEISALRGY